MLCQNCGRRSSDTKSFCEHCGAIASPDVPASATPPKSEVRESRRARRRAAALETAARLPRVERRSGGASNALATLIFWGLMAGGVYWVLSDSGRELRTLIMDLLQQYQQQESAAPVTSPVEPPPTSPARSPGSARPSPARPARGAGQPDAATPEAPARSTEGPPPIRREAAPALQPAAALPQGAGSSAQEPRTAPDPTLEGLSPGQVIQRLGRPTAVITSSGVTAWSYRDGALIVYFVKDRATLKPPR